MSENPTQSVSIDAASLPSPFVVRRVKTSGYAKKPRHDLLLLEWLSIFKWRMKAHGSDHRVSEKNDIMADRQHNNSIDISSRDSKRSRRARRDIISHPAESY
jgi:hypothetical protein